MRRFFKSKRTERAQQLRVPKSPPNWPENKGDSHPIRHRTDTWDDGATRCSVGDQAAPWTPGRTATSIDVFSLPGLPVWVAPSTLKGNFENRDEDLSVASCVESLWSTKTARAPAVLDREDQGFHQAVMSKLGLQRTQPKLVMIHHTVERLHVLLHRCQRCLVLPSQRRCLIKA
ncbi:hypothetical protein HPB47_016705 [Ixodes persulcatus]|uniref:Uncharacterized protein n=1 Tax=Ixodes persulcatus TaxID=34615 RepID=A0AC60QSR5_IXOPE|nr:hypothetical protein HPB47_016705 [Ixodes persulcatus]